MFQGRHLQQLEGWFSLQYCNKREAHKLCCRSSQASVRTPFKGCIEASLYYIYPQEEVMIERQQYIPSAPAFSAALAVTPISATFWRKFTTTGIFTDS